MHLKLTPVTKKKKRFYWDCTYILADKACAMDNFVAQMRVDRGEHENMIATNGEGENKGQGENLLHACIIREWIMRNKLFQKKGGPQITMYSFTISSPSYVQTLVSSTYSHLPARLSPHSSQENYTDRATAACRLS
jgi:hypothetical protein